MSATDIRPQDTESDVGSSPPGSERFVPSRARQLLGARATGDASVKRLARGWRSLARPPRGSGAPLKMVPVTCDICGPTPVEPVGVGEDFEYWTSPDSFLAVQCTQCGLVFLDPRPDISELGRIYPPGYHAFDFSEERFGLVHRMRERFEARRLLRWTRGLPPGARIVDVGCGDGFHLDLLRRFGHPTWELEGVEPDSRAARVAQDRGLRIHGSTLADARLEADSVDLVLLVQTIEHVPDPRNLLSQIAHVLRPGGRLVVVTDNIGSPDFRLFRSRHWGGWHFPRHWHLYSRDTLARTGHASGLEVDRIETQVSPVNWVYSVRNLLADLGAPASVTRHLSLESPLALAAGTVLDTPLALTGRGALLRATFRKPVGGHPRA